MKTLITVCFALFLFNANAQDWSPFNKTERFNYQTDTIAFITSNYFSDSTITVGTDSVFYLNRVVKPLIETWDTVMVLKNQPQYWERKMIRKDSGVYQFTDPGNKVLYTWAQPNQSWVFDSLQNIVAIVDSLIERNIFGTADSVKIIGLSNGKKIELSKHHGLISFPQDDTSQHVSMLIGIDGRNVGELMPTFVSLFHLTLPDSLCYSDGCGVAPGAPVPNQMAIYNHAGYKVFTQELIGDSLYRYPGSMYETLQKLYFNGQLVAENDAFNDNFTWERYKSDYPLLSSYHCNSLYALDTIHTVWGSHYGGRYAWVRLDKSYDSRITVHADYALHPLNDSCIDCGDTLVFYGYNEEIGYYYHVFAEGIGYVEEDYGGFEWGCADGYDGACSVTNATQKNAYENNVSVFPVPAFDFVNVTSGPCSATLTNSLGLVVEQFGKSTFKSIDLTSHPSGIYYLVVDCDGMLHRRIVVKQ